MENKRKQIRIKNRRFSLCENKNRYDISYIRIYTYIRTCMHACMHTYTCAYMYACVCMGACLCVYIYIYILYILTSDKRDRIKKECVCKRERERERERENIARTAIARRICFTCPEKSSIRSFHTEVCMRECVCLRAYT
jgi:hypothetical protein